jgi:dihydrofolate reductase
VSSSSCRWTVSSRGLDLPRRTPKAASSTGAGRSPTATRFSAPPPRGLAATDAYLVGRKTYEKMAAYWPTAPKMIPSRSILNSTAKYVVSTALADADWHNSAVIKGNVVEAVAKLKDQPGKNIAVLGSGGLVQTLIKHDLADEYFLTVYPLVLGSGKRLFRDFRSTHEAETCRLGNDEERWPDPHVPTCSISHHRRGSPTTRRMSRTGFRRKGCPGLAKNAPPTVTGRGRLSF